jgi:uncharacterized protein YbjT (DUF2867 family)
VAVHPPAGFFHLTGMRIAVVGGTGLVGRHVTKALERAGHEAVVVARSRGVDLTTGEGLDEALAGVEATIDVSNTLATDPDEARRFFELETRTLLDAAQRARVGHHVVLSIVGVDRVEGNAHYAGKRRQEELARAGPIPFTILRATQFFDFAEMVVGWMRRDGAARIPPLLVQPVAVADTAAVLVELAAGPAQGLGPELAGPETQDLVDMARRTLTARGDRTELIPTWRAGVFGIEMAGEVLLPGPDARIASTTFEAWLASLARL